MYQKSKQIITIDSESDIDSSPLKQIMKLDHDYDYCTFNQHKQQQDLYYKFHSSKFFMLTESLKKYAQQISDFLENPKKNVLFIFGPSGCGKTTLVTKILEYNEIQSQKIEENEDQTGRAVPLSSMIIQSLRKMSSQIVYFCCDFPITIQKWNMEEIGQFKYKFSQQIKKTITKTIFILNQQIYNSYYVVNERAQSQQNLNYRENVSIIKFEKFGVLETKKILKSLVEQQKLSQFVVLTKDFLQEIVQVSGGDLRKAINKIYWRGVENKAEKILQQQKNQLQAFETQKKLRNQCRNQFKTCEELELEPNFSFLFDEEDQDEQHSKQDMLSNKKNEHSNSLSSMNKFAVKSLKKTQIQQQRQNYSDYMSYKESSNSRCSLYHGLGKLLYGKRLNIKRIPKNKKQISSYYTQQQIHELDPPFYFDPLYLFEQMRVDLDMIVRLLQQNYLERYGKIKDVRKMSDIFRTYDGFFSFTNFLDDEEVKQIKIKLITWGILIYNKNSRTDNMAFRKIQKSQCCNIDRKIKEKRRLIKQYFPGSNFHDLIKFAHITREKMSHSLLNQTLFNTSISRQHFVKFDDHTKTLNENEEEQLQTILKIKVNQIQNKLRQSKRIQEIKNKQMEQIFAELEDNQSQFDQISDSD